MIEAKEAAFVRSVAHRSTSSIDGKRYQREITRELFEQLITPIVDRTLGALPRVHHGRRRDGRADRRSGAGRRLDAHPAGARGGRERCSAPSRTPS